VLFDLIEEEFNLPAALVDSADRRRGQGELIGERDKALAGVGSWKRTWRKWLG
jgi:hypothetical protein